jgi:hypothetical protein
LKKKKEMHVDLCNEDQAKIKILHRIYDNLHNHPVNKAIRLHNEFIMLTFKAKDFSREIDMPFYNQLTSLGSKVGIKLPPRRFLTMDMFRPGSKTAMQMKETLWFWMTNELNQSNNIPSYLVHRELVKNQ